MDCFPIINKYLLYYVLLKLKNFKKMKINVFIIILFILAILSSCNFNNTSKKDEIIHFKKFPKSLLLVNGEPIKLDITSKIGLFHPLKDFLILHDFYSSDKGIYILDKSALCLVKKTGEIGKGPEEIGRYGNIYNDILNNCFFVADFGKNVIWKYCNDSLLNNNYKPIKYVSFNTAPNVNPYDFIIKNDSLYFMSELDYFMVKMADDGTYKHLSKYKEEIIGLDKSKVNENTYSTLLTSAPDKSKYAFAFKYAEIITVTDENFIPLVSSYGKGKTFYGENKFKDVVYYIYHLTSDEHFIYASFLNRPSRQEDVKYGNHKTNYPQTIRIFTWEGKPVLEMKSENPFSDFYVDRENNRVILYLTNKENPIYVFDVDFSEILK